ncbi:MAG: long-chain fatty acid--CoA ligase [Acidobacteriota bacterium]|nr:long-chain fatty acid--CoA ligase [Blastocatellia bacterium]MDW8240055.1 long-chain fatty acid--CoA ligase [Acidobacteriota bacterium]
MNYPNIATLFWERIDRYHHREVFYVRQQGRWVGIPWSQLGQQAHEFGCALIADGLAPGTSVCVLMGQVPEWPISDLGTILAGGVTVGIYPTASAEQCQYIINHSDAAFVVVDTASQLDKILLVRHTLPRLKRIIVLDEALADAGADVRSFQQFLAHGRQHWQMAYPVLQQRAASAQPDDTAIMVYTSGTTGPPKGACLSHRYIINSVESLLATIPIYDTDRSFSYLPYCHVAERIAGFYNRLYAGAPAYFVDDLTKLWTYMLEVKPTVFGSVPRFYEKIHARIIADLEQASGAERDQFYQALELGRIISRRRQARQPIPSDLQQRYQDWAQPLLSRVKDYFGGEIRITTSGGAPLPLDIAEFFDAAGIPILQAYGLTENICVAFNRPDNNKFGTVGPPMPGCEVKLADDGELLVRSQMMFTGYYKDPEQTAAMFQDGWLLTGDLAEIDDEGFIKIIGRKKELIVTSTGKNVSPMLIENMLKEHPLISHAMVYGDGKSYLVALITLNQMETEEYARSRAIPFSRFAELTQHPEIVSLVEQIVTAANKRVSSTEAIKKFVILDHDLSIEADEITPTLKVKRAVVARRYRALLERLYEVSA